MKNPQEMTDEELIHEEFNRRFSVMSLSTETLDVILSRLPEDVRRGHYFEMKEIVQKESFKREIEDWKRRVLRILALGAKNDMPLSAIQLQGLRTLLLEIDNFVSVIERRATLYSPPSVIRANSSKV